MTHQDVPLARPDVQPPKPDVAAVEAAIRQAIDDDRHDLLTMIGAGELSIAIRWDAGGEPCVVKRLPPFPSRRSAEAYCSIVRSYIHDLTANGVRCVTTELHTLQRADGSVVVFHCQPLLTAKLLADHVLRAAPPSADHPIVTQLVETDIRVVRAGIPIDPQVANWYWFDGELWHLDFSTPLVLDDGGDIRFDTTGFRREYPWVVRRVVYRELMKIARNYQRVEFSLDDIVNGLLRQDLGTWVSPVDEAAKRHGVTIDLAAANRRYESDTKFYPTLLRLKRLERRWRRLTRRSYDGLLPATSSFG